MAGPVSIAPWSAPAAPIRASASFVRLWRGFANARVAVAAALLLLLAALFSVQPGPAGQGWLLGLCGFYLFAALLVRRLVPPPRRDLDWVWLTSLGLDVAVIVTLHFFQAGGVNLSPLLAVPVLMASVLGGRPLAFGTAAAATLLLLAEAWLQALAWPSEAAPRFFQAGLTGLGYFALALLAHQMAARLAREEASARRSAEAARLQAQVNELVIETLADGILVVGLDGRVRAANPTACSLLGAPGIQPGFLLSEDPGWDALLQLAQRTIAFEANQISEASIDREGAAPRRVMVRTRLAAPAAEAAEAAGGLCVLFLEDLRELEARVRTEKLAAMGRMSAAVAHEIRNPLAAIAQANALLDEDLTDPAQRQLSALVRQNAQRLAQIVDEVLSVSRVRQQGPAHSVPIELDAHAAAVVRDWAAQTGHGARLQLLTGASGALVPFEPDHLRRVLVNLLDNAARHASDRPGAILVATSRGGSHASLGVWSDGPPPEDSVRRHLFEPFFSSESRSSGLGLFICRELCERHGAQIGYRRGPARQGAAGEGNEFFIDFRPVAVRAAGMPAARITP